MVLDAQSCQHEVVGLCLAELGLSRRTKLHTALPANLTKGSLGAALKEDSRVWLL